MTLEQIKDEIRSLRSSERIELYKWLDYGVVADYGVATGFCPRIGTDRYAGDPSCYRSKVSKVTLTVRRFILAYT